MSIEYKTPNNQIRRIRSGDPDFVIHDNWAQYPRASIELSQDCPAHIKMAIHEGRRKGWLKLTAAVYDHELMWEKLSR